jgi:XTP/dITP diphosphohydrolase
MKLLLASQNQGKLKELRTLLQDLPLTVIGFNQLKLARKFMVKETGKTFRQNAIIKAKAYAQKTNYLTLAEDSGLMVDVLDGRPGLHSARFAQGNFKAAMKRLLQLIKSVPKPKRTAKFVCVIALYDPKTKRLHTFRGQADGWISFRPLGDGGFGYDPIFVSKSLNKTFAQATPQEKNLVSHRARALKKLKTYLKNNFSL